MSLPSLPPSPSPNLIADLVVNAISPPSLHASSPSLPASTPPPSTSTPVPPHIAPPEPTVSLQSILAASKDPPAHNGQHPPWPVLPMVMPTQHHLPSSSTPKSTNASGKRKLEDADAEDPHPKIRRVVREHVAQDPARVVPMTTIICLHAAVAQKSYGSEKRFLCPPPVVHIEGPVWHMRSQQMSMSVVSETGERNFEQKAALDSSMTASFKFLHVTGTAKAKSFLLSLDIAEPPSTPVTVPEGESIPTGRVWASFDSAPVTIISKPSKKTAKTRNISSCILAGGPVSLFNRINSQTVRTKYMTIDNNQLCASNVSWSAFNVNVVRRTQDLNNVAPQPVTYGSEVILTDTMSGISTAPLVIRKVDKGRIAGDDGGPVSQMQKIALQRINQDGSRHYLSAAGPVPGSGGAMSPPPPAGQAGTHPLIFQSPRIREEVKDGVRLFTDEVDDYLCWTIVGISKFQYTFFDAFGPNNGIPDMPITPFPTLFTAPVYRPANNTLELTVSNFFYDDSKSGQHAPLDIYLGNLGPLRARVYEAAPPGPLTTISPFVPAADPAGQSDGANGTTAPRYMHSALHTIVIVEMPMLSEIIKALEGESPRPTTPAEGANGAAASGGASGSSTSTPVPTPSGTEDQDPNAIVPSQDLTGRSLPLLFIRSSDGIGYHSGRTIACENVFHNIDLMGGAPQNGQPLDGGWLAAAQAAAAAEGGLHGWTLRVM
ncbi:hypothetical protein OF83DRAFT_1053296 [Amylostereum chailletii]|nr:hypothetical protein OF83DRAFT_1053296 [Amylostereum chailletii]